MSLDATGRPGEDCSCGPGGAGRRLYGTLTSFRFALTIGILLVVACILGTVLPQGGEVAGYLRKHPSSEGMLKLLSALGLTRVFSCWWFIGLLGLLSASLISCTSRRALALRAKTGRARGRGIGSLMTHVSMILIFAGAVLRAVYGEKGQIDFRVGESAESFLSADGRRPLPFTVRLADFAIEEYENGPAGEPAREKLVLAWREGGKQVELTAALGVAHDVDGGAAGAPGYRVTVLRTEPDFVMGRGPGEIYSRSAEPRNPAAQVEVVAPGGGFTNTMWLFAMHPDFNMHGPGAQELPFEMRYEAAGVSPRERYIRDYKSTLQVIVGGTVVREKTIEVNAPLSYGGYTLYQSGYDPADPKWTSIQVVKDPGVPVVYAGFAFMVTGLILLFYMYPQDRSGGAKAEDSPGGAP